MNLSIESSPPANPPVDLADTFNIQNADGRVLAQVNGGSAVESLESATGSPREQWTIVANGDGSYKVINEGSKDVLSVDASGEAGRAWAFKPIAAADDAGVGQDWFFFGKRLVNRYSGLVLSMSDNPDRLVETTPFRSWADAGASPVGGNRRPEEQSLSFVPAG